MKRALQISNRQNFGSKIRNPKSEIRNLYVIILAGGSGTRFWPLSRESYPKQLLRLAGPETMLQHTVAMAQRAIRHQLPTPSRIYIVTHEQQADAVRMQIRSAIRNSNFEIRILLEPSARNTAAAIGLAASQIFQQDQDAILVVMPADHIIKKQGLFTQAVREACRIAAKGYLVTFGIKPTRPETGFGYIKRGVRGQGSGAREKIKTYEVKKFVEKPDRATAKRYLKEGSYYWNSGIFVFEAGAILNAIQRHLPLLGRGLRAIEKARGTEREREVIRRIYQGLPSVSIDYGVMERIGHRQLVLLPVDMGWSDVGTWSALGEILPENGRGNIIRGNVIDLGCQNSILYADRRPVAIIGVKDMVVVDTPDATLICQKDRAQEVRKVVEILKKRGAEEQMTPRTVERPWGSFTVLEVGRGYKIKRFMVRPGARLSLQLHRHRSEHWVVVQGVARVTRNDEVFDVHTHKSTYIPKGAKHRIENPGREPLEIIEVQNGDYLGEDDIVRYQDDYGRDVKR